MTASSRIADFRSPPISEVVLGVQFEPLPSFSSAFQGLYWSRIRERFPRAQDAPALMPVIEQLDDAPTGEITFTAGAVAPRVFLFDKSDRQLVQLQPDRFHHNWRKAQDDDAYPHYDEIRTAFLRGWTDFSSFCESEKLGRPRVRQYELSYINHIFEGVGWTSEVGLPSVFPWFAPKNPLVATTDATFALRCPVPDAKGRLHVSARTGLRVTDRRKVIVFELTLRGAPTTIGDDSDMVAWCDRAHEIIVKSFVHLTSDAARQAWGQVK